MAKQHSDKSSYPSRYSPKGWVTAAQYICELVCEVKARKDKTTLPVKFWDLKEWNKFYRWQIKVANQLLEKFPAEAIIKALKDKKCFYVYSLNAPQVRKLAEKYKLEIESKQKQIDEKLEDYDNSNIVTTPRPTQVTTKTLKGLL
jgi:hypothetical protein